MNKSNCADKLFPIIFQATKSKKFTNCLCLTNFMDIKPLLLFNEDIIPFIEEYVGLECSSFDRNLRKMYIDDKYLDDPESFTFSEEVKENIISGMKIVKIYLKNEIKLAEQVHKSGLNNMKNESCDDNDDANVNSEDLENENSVLNNDNSKIVYLSEDSSEGSSENSNDNDGYKVNCKKDLNKNSLIKYINEETVKKATKAFKNCVLVPHRDFEIEMPDKTSIYGNEPLTYGIYICKLCKNKLCYRHPHFSISENQNLIFRGIHRHLKTHFPVKIQKKIKYNNETVDENEFPLNPFYDDVVKSVEKRFKKTLIPQKDFFLELIDQENIKKNKEGYFICGLCWNSKNVCYKNRFEISERGNITFKAIFGHLRKIHFQ